jgi:hypothetical protein
MQGAYGTMTKLAASFPDRRPGSPGDTSLARYLAGRLSADQFAVAMHTFNAHTALGPRRLTTVVATRTGLMPGAVVVVAGRDALGSPATASLSGTAVLLQLARILSGQTQPRTVVLVSTSGSVGASGAAQLAEELVGQQPDAVIVLGDLASTRVRQPLVIPWSNVPALAPPILRNTLAAAIAAQAGLRSASGSLVAQFSHLALPLAATAQGPFAEYGIPAVEVSASGEQTSGPAEAIDPARLAGLGAAVVQAVDALSASPAVPGPAPYLMLGGKLVPAWAIRLLVLALIAPVALTVVDAFARARRRGHRMTRWVMWVLVSAIPFLLAWLLIQFALLTGWLGATPPSPVWAGGVDLGSSELALLGAVGLVLVGSFVLLRRLLALRISSVGAEGPKGSELDGAAIGLMLVMSLTSLVIWLANPFSALLVVPALHLWLWFAEPSVRARRVLLVGALLLGLVAPAVLVAYYVSALGLSVVAALWAAVLLSAGGGLSALAVLYWSVLLGCVASAIAIVGRSFRQRVSQQEPVVTIRGPVTYAGPGSLGGTKSAMRR